MAVNTVEVLTANIDRGPSFSIWADCPIAEILENPGKGMYYFEDFLSVPNVAAGAQAAYGNYLGYADTGGSVTEAAQGSQTGGVKVFSSDGDNEGASLQMVGKPFQIDRAFQTLWFEARIQTSTIADTKHDIFVGLIENCTLSATVPITAAGAIADQNVVGFFRPESARTVAGTGGAIMNVVYKANGVAAVTLANDAVALVANTWTKLGMTFRPSRSIPGNYYIQFYQDGVEITAARYQVVTAQGTDFPNDVGLSFFMAVLNATGTTPGSSSCDWFRVAQLF